MQIRENGVYIEAIKLAAGSVQYKDISVKDTFIDAVFQLYQYYQNTENIKYLETSILHIQAYLEMGFPYEEGKDVFDLVLKVRNYKRVKIPPKILLCKKGKIE